MSSVLDPHLIVRAHEIEELDDFEVVHLHTTGSRGSAEPVFVIRAVDINIPGVGID